MNGASGFAGSMTSTKVSASTGLPPTVPSLINRAVSFAPTIPAAPMMRICMLFYDSAADHGVALKPDPSLAGGTASFPVPARRVNKVDGEGIKMDR